MKQLEPWQLANFRCFVVTLRTDFATVDTQRTSDNHHLGIRHEFAGQPNQRVNLGSFSPAQRPIK